MAETYFLKLRGNIELQGDVSLAEGEARALFHNVRTAATAAEAAAMFPISTKLAGQNTRPSPPIGFVTGAAKADLTKLVRQLSFVQELWFVPSATSGQAASDVPWLHSARDGTQTLACCVPLMAAAELLSFNGALRPGVQNLRDLVRYLASGEARSKTSAAAALRRNITSTAHVHGLHKYKAKFFPRMIRSFVVRVLDKLPRQADGGVVLLDPFLGSGTALVEALLLGLDGIGIDIDLLSCYISKAKMDLLTLENAGAVDTAVQQLRNEHDGLFRVARDRPSYVFPPWIVRKFERWHSPEEQRKYEAQISGWISAIEPEESEQLRRIFRVCLSDAISRKFNIRMMGTGVGRFALEIAEADLSSIMESDLDNLVRMAYTSSLVRSAYDVAPMRMNVINDTATAMPLADGSVSLILTSPPYLPASSGRENYLVGKSISITALGMMTPTEIQEADNRSVGSMKYNGSLDFSGLPGDVADLHKWLTSDPLRAIKADPTVLYYMSLKQALVESYRVLQPGGIAVYVIGKESVFYQFRTRKVLYRVPCDKIFLAMAEGCGFEVEDVINVELNKKNRNARPRALDSYYESAVFLRKC